ncbi:helix-turn-helix domain-containing protein [Cellulomonas sp.]|uniref:helix-turn-helix domain-containing protein n=1 Tax=Cellulomonas sp. TaxID=40001 RepID=UPI00338D9FCB
MTSSPLRAVRLVVRPAPRRFRQSRRHPSRPGPRHPLHRRGWRRLSGRPGLSLPAQSRGSADRWALRAEVLRYAASGVSAREAGRLAGASPSSAQRWVAEAKAAGVLDAPFEQEQPVLLAV